MRIPLFVSTALLITIVVWAAFIWDPEAMGPAARDPVPEPLDLAHEPAGGGFTLQGADGPVSLSGLGGEVAILCFGYTYSPERTPRAVGTVAAALDRLGERAEGAVHGVFISLDPQRDTPDRVARLADRFDARIVGLTGEPAAIESVADRYGVAYRRREGGPGVGYTVAHSAYYYIVRTDGELLAWLPHDSSPAEIASAVEEHLATGNGRATSEQE